MMRRGTVIQFYKSMPAAEQFPVRRWARMNTVLFTTLAGLLAAMLALASTESGAQQVAAKRVEIAGYSSQHLTFVPNPVPEELRR